MAQPPEVPAALQPDPAAVARREFTEAALITNEVSRNTIQELQQALQACMIDVEQAQHSHGRIRAQNLRQCARNLRIVADMTTGLGTETEIARHQWHEIRDTWYPGHSQQDIIQLRQVAALLNSRAPVTLPPREADAPVIRHTGIRGERWTYQARSSEETVVAMRLREPTARELRLERFIQEAGGEGAARNWPTPESD